MTSGSEPIGETFDIGRLLSHRDSITMRAERDCFRMQRKRAIAIAAEQQAFRARLVLAAGLLLLPALLLLLISP